MKLSRAMKHLILLCAIFGTTLTKPNGLYHEEFEYKSSQQSYRNNELQEKNDDEGFYSKDGDLEGRVRPKIKSHEQHSQYVNPRSQNQYNHGSSIYDNSYGGSSLGSIYDRPDMSHLSTGHYGSSSNSQYGSSSSSQYGSSSQYDTAALSQLTERLEQDLSRQLEAAVREQYSRYSDYSMGSSHMQTDMQSLEEQLRSNLTQQLENALRSQYGSQAMQGGYSYSISGGTISPTANYNNAQLEQMKRQLEDSLIRELNNQMRTVYTTSSHSSRTSYGTTGGQVSYPSHPVVTYPRYTSYPSYPSGGSSSSVSSHSSHSSYRQYTPIPNPESITNIASRVQTDLDNYINQLLDETRTKYLINRDRYSTVSDLDRYIQNLKYDLQRNITTFFDEELRRNYGTQTHVNSYSYSVASDGDVSPTSNYKLSDLENLKRQIEQHLQSKIDRDFQTIKQRFVQVQSSSTSSSTSSNSGYRPIYIPYGSSTNGQLVTNNIYGSSSTSSGSSGSQMSSYEWNTLQRQLQEDLSRQLQEALRQHQYDQSTAYSSSTFNPNQNYQVTLQELTDELQRNLTQRLQERLQASRVSGSSSSSYTYGVAGGSYSPSSDQLASLQSQLQNDLMQQLQQGLQQSYSKYSSFSASSSYGYGGGRVSGSQVLGDDPYEDCTYGDQPHDNHRHRRSVDEPKVITRTYKYTSHSSLPSTSGYSHHSSSHGISSDIGGDLKLSDIFDDDALDAVQKSMRMSAGSHYSGFGGNYHEGISESAGGLGYHASFSESPVSHSYSTFGNSHSRKPIGSQTEISFGEELDDDDLKQLSESFGFGGTGSSNLNSHGSSNSESVTRYSHVTSGTTRHQRPFSSQTQIQLGQQGDHSHALQQETEDFGFGRLNGGSSRGHSGQLSGSVTRHTYVTSSTNNHRKPTSGQTEIEFGQEVDNSDDLKQETEDFGFGKLSSGSFSGGHSNQNTGSITRHTYITSTTNNHGKPTSGQTEIDLDQEVDNKDDLQQETEDFGFGKLTGGSSQGHSGQVSGSVTRRTYVTSSTNNYRKPTAGQTEIEFGQEVDNSDDLKQETEDFGIGKLSSGSLSGGHSNQHTGSITRHTYVTSTTNHHGKPTSGQTEIDLDQEVDNKDDLQQETEDFGLGKLTHGSSQGHSGQFSGSVTRRTYVTSTTNNHRKPTSGQTEIEFGQQVDNSDDLKQETEDFGFGKLSSGSLSGGHSNQNSGSITRHTYVTSTTRHEKPTYGQTEIELGQEVDNNEDAQQQSEDFGFGKLTSGSLSGGHSAQTSGTVTRHSVTTTTTTRRQKPFTTQAQIELGQEVDDTDDLQQQSEDFGLDKLNAHNPREHGSISVTRVTQTHTTQGDHALGHTQTGSGTNIGGSTEVIHQLEDSGFGRLGTLKPAGQHRLTDGSTKPEGALHIVSSQHTEYGQHRSNTGHAVQPLHVNNYGVQSIEESEEDQKFTQQTVALTNQQNSHRTEYGHKPSGQQEIDDDFPSQNGLTQQVEDSFEKIDKSQLLLGGQQEEDDEFLSHSSTTQQVEDNGFNKISKLEFGGQQEEDDEFNIENGRTEQVEDSFGKVSKTKLQFGGQQEIEDSSFENIDVSSGSHQDKTQIQISQSKIDGSRTTQKVNKDITNFINGEIEDSRKIQETNNLPTGNQQTITTITGHGSSNIHPSSNQIEKTSESKFITNGQQTIDSDEALTFGQKLAEEDYLRRVQGGENGQSTAEFGTNGYSGGFRKFEQTSTSYGSSSYPATSSTTNIRRIGVLPGTGTSTSSHFSGDSEGIFGGYQTRHQTSGGSYGNGFESSVTSTGFGRPSGSRFSYQPSESGDSHTIQRTVYASRHQSGTGGSTTFHSGGSEDGGVHSGGSALSGFGNNMETTSDQHPGKSYVLDYSYRRVGIPTVSSGKLESSFSGGASLLPSLSTSGHSRTFGGSLTGPLGGTLSGSLTASATHPHVGYSYHSSSASSSGDKIGIKGV